jgi:hypothetical protein
LNALARIELNRSLSSILSTSGEIGAAIERSVNPGWGRRLILRSRADERE